MTNLDDAFRDEMEDATSSFPRGASSRLMQCNDHTMNTIEGTTMKDGVEQILVIP